MKNKNKLITLTVLLTLAVLLTACAEPTAEPVSRTELLLDTACTVTLYDPADPDLLDGAFALIAQADARLSRTVAGSDIFRINEAGGALVEVDSDTAQLIEQGLYYSELSGGCFDISVGRLTALWDFGGSNHLPTEAELAEVLPSIGWQQIAVEGNTVTVSAKAGECPHLELGAIAKGHIADLVADWLREQDVHAAIVDLGGNVVTVGAKADGASWNVGVQQPFGAERSELVGMIRVDGDCSLVTSGVYERNFEQDGVLYHHILDPATGFPADTDVIGVTIVSDRSLDGDALSTISLLLGQEAGSRLLEKCEGVRGAVWVRADGEVFVQGDIDFIPADSLN